MKRRRLTEEEIASLREGTAELREAVATFHRNTLAILDEQQARREKLLAALRADIEEMRVDLRDWSERENL